ncbi:hypothetical protein ISF_05589 [Cordyceps fumosorosea ARSEF 2679]|uniref:BZIP domain-containing protein n=1 Tax=Cordyceps fumosorosea (strain ARSEF 2679) TaxID=1081104 RepID=A0A167UEN2_CORFA|nr:hypothetical protein ISF_05589 [Cordyceps fumosorosea ARSEF 2679]OAA61510.1 hypothetical protein ISF_05589 [Cordyceps fumosorosea ARSEF 2679]
MNAEDAEERKQRKRLQNRINQRQRRSRKREEAQASSQSQIQRPYQVDRWRHVYQHDANEPVTTTRRQVASVSTLIEHDTIDSSRVSSLRGTGPSPLAPSVRPFRPCPTQDHLLHLIHVNVLRGLLANKMALLACAQYLTRGVTSAASELQPTPAELVFPCRAAVVAAVAAAVGLPASLEPTPLQRTVVHAACIDLFPFPGVRDAMIAREGRGGLDLAALVADLVGDLVDPAYFLDGSLPRPETTPPAMTGGGSEGEGEDDYTANRNGLILWGEAHRPESWEVTPGFLRRWGWLVKDCRGGLVESSNRWRAARGEEPLSG